MERPRPGLSKTAKFVTVIAVIAFDCAAIEAIEAIWPGAGWRHFQLWAIVIAPTSWFFAEKFLKRRYGTARWEREVAFQAHQRSMAVPYLFRYWLPAFSAVMLVLMVAFGWPDWSAAHGGGTVGSLTITSRGCDRAGDCHWVGTFTSADKSYSKPGMTILDAVPATTAVGQTLPVRDAGSADDVYAIDGSTTWHTAAWIAGACAAYLLGWLVWLIRRRLSRRPDRPDLTTRLANDLRGPAPD